MPLHSTHVDRDSLGGGRYRDEIALKPIAYRKDGNLRRITDTLTASGDPAFPLGVSQLCDFRIDPRIAGKSPLIHFGKGASFARFALVGANNGAGVVSGNAITFNNAWDNADLTYRMGGHRLQEDILLRANHPRTFSFRIQEHVGFDPVTLMFGNDFRILQPTLEPPAGSLELAKSLQWLVTQQGGFWVLSVTLPNDQSYDGWTLDPTLTLQPDSTDGVDTWLHSGNPTYNYGADHNSWIGFLSITARKLTKFDLSSISSAATITSAVLSLYLTEIYGSTNRTYRVYRQKRLWTEGTGAGSATGDGATWNKYDSTNDWQTAGGFGANDCEQTDIGNLSIPWTATLNQFYNWVLTPTTTAALDLGNGWMVKADTESDDGRLFPSSDHVTAAYRPKLVVEWSLPGGGGARRMFVPDLGYFHARGA